MALPAFVVASAFAAVPAFVVPAHAVAPEFVAAAPAFVVPALAVAPALAAAIAFAVALAFVVLPSNFASCSVVQAASVASDSPEERDSRLDKVELGSCSDYCTCSGQN